MSIAVSSTSLREKGDMLLSGATPDQEKEPRGVEGKTSFARPGWLSPLVSAGAEWLRMPSRPERLGDVPPNSFQSPPVKHHYGYPMASGLIFGDDKWLRKKSHASLEIWSSAQY